MNWIKKVVKMSATKETKYHHLLSISGICSTVRTRNLQRLAGFYSYFLSDLAVPARIIQD